MKKKAVSSLPLLPLSPMPPLAEEIDYDSLWKFLIEAFGFQFLRRFLPDLYAEVDLSHPIEYMDQEFSSKLRPRKKGRKITDKLLKVRLLSGEERFVLAHIEVHATGESTFGKKMYLYNSMIFLRYELDVTALAIFTTERYPSNHNRYVRECFGTKVSLEFNSFIISKQDVRKLSKSYDLFDLAILACLYIIRTRNNMQKRLYYKKKLHKMAIEKKFSHTELEKILIFVEDIMQLPLPLEVKFKKHLKFKNKNLETMELSQNSKEMFAAMYEGHYGTTFEALNKKIEKERSGKEKALSEKEKERSEKEKALLQAEEQRLKAEAIQVQMILLLHIQNHFSIEKIVEDYKFDLEFVKETLKKYLDEQEKSSQNTEGEQVS
jgi:hypothetical protein